MRQSRPQGLGARRWLLVLSLVLLAVGCSRVGFGNRSGDGSVGSDGSPVGDGARIDGALDGADGLFRDGRDGPLEDGIQADGPSGDIALAASWVTVPAGTFTMGSKFNGQPCGGLDAPLHQVTLTRGFELQSTEVTQAQFEALMGYNPSYFGPGGNGADCGSNCPVERVSWHEAAAFCNELSQQAGLGQCYSCSGSGTSLRCTEAGAYSGAQVYACPGYRLPTEAEWEHAARAGSTTEFYSGSDDWGVCGSCTSLAHLDAIAWYCSNAGDTTHPVAQKQANALGLVRHGGQRLRVVSRLVRRGRKRSGDRSRRVHAGLHADTHRPRGQLGGHGEAGPGRLSGFQHRHRKEQRHGVALRENPAMRGLNASCSGNQVSELSAELCNRGARAATSNPTLC